MAAKKRVTASVWVDPDDAPEWTQNQFDRAEIAIGGKVVRPAQGTLTRPRGRPKKADAKVHIHIRLSPQVLGLSVPAYNATVHYQQVRDSWAGVRTPDGR